MFPRIAVVVAVNDTDLLAANLMRSPMIATGDVPIVIERGHPCAAKAYNAGMNRTTAEYIVFAHQDVYFPFGWEQKLFAAIKVLGESSESWGALGVLGVQVTGRVAGRAWCAGNHREFGIPLERPQEIASLDEIVIVLKASTPVRFDEDLPGYHLYGTDIVLCLQEHGLRSYAFDGPVIHNTKTIIQLRSDYTACYQYMQRKWRNRLPVATTVMDVTYWGWPLYKRWLRVWKRTLLGQVKVHPRASDVQQLAAHLGYDQPIANAGLIESLPFEMGHSNCSR